MYNVCMVRTCKMLIGLLNSLKLVCNKKTKHLSYTDFLLLILNSHWNSLSI